MEKKAPYEMGFLVNGKLTQEQAEDYTNQIRSAIQDDARGIITEESQLHKRKLAYPINKERNAYFGTMKFDTAKTDLQKLNEKLKFEQNLVRYLILLIDPKKLSDAKPRRKPRTAAAPIAPKTEKKPSEEIKIKELEKKLEEIIEG